MRDCCLKRTSVIQASRKGDFENRHSLRSRLANEIRVATGLRIHPVTRLHGVLDCIMVAQRVRPVEFTNIKHLTWLRVGGYKLSRLGGSCIVGLVKVLSIDLTLGQSSPHVRVPSTTVAVPISRWSRVVYTWNPIAVKVGVRVKHIDRHLKIFHQG